MARAVAVLQARSTSRRLPGKILLPILGQPMIVRQIERIQRANLLDTIIVATSTDSSDDELVHVLGKHQIHVHRGSLDNVLDRFYQAALSTGFRPEHIVRLTADCPLADPAVIDSVIAQHLAAQADYTSNTLTPTFPDGLDVEVMNWKTLERTHQKAQDPFELEHVTPYIYRHPEYFTLKNCLRPEGDLAHLRWTVDESDDYQLVKKIYEALYPVNSEFTSSDILSLLQGNPSLSKLNQRFKRNEGSN